MCVCVSVCVCVCAQRTGQSDQFTTVKATEFRFDMLPGTVWDIIPQKSFEKGVWPGSRDPLNFRALNVNSSKMVEATDFKFDVRVSRDSPDMTP